AAINLLPVLRLDGYYALALWLDSWNLISCTCRVIAARMLRLLGRPVQSRLSARFQGLLDMPTDALPADIRGFMIGTALLTAIVALLLVLAAFVGGESLA